jgi:hypothetical protein
VTQDVFFATSQTISGLAGHGNNVNFGNLLPASDFTITSGGDGVSFTVSSPNPGGGTYHLSNINAITFQYQTEIVAAAPGTTKVTTGNITELYAAVFGREPDVAGLSYYQGLLQANPNLPLTVFAQWFLASPEYTGNSAHNYAQTAAGDAQFITASYKNLLNRAPGSGDVAWYQTNVINPILGNAAPGSAAYSQAETLAHAALLVDFSASAEFLNDVQITAAHPASYTHWLYLI